MSATTISPNGDRASGTDTATDLLGTALTPSESALLAAYSTLKGLAAESLPPCAASNVRVALSALGVALTDAVIDFEHLTDLGC